MNMHGTTTESNQSCNDAHQAHHEYFSHPIHLRSQCVDDRENDLARQLAYSNLGMIFQYALDPCCCCISS